MHEDQYAFLSHLPRFFLGREMFHTKAVMKIKAHVSSPVASSYGKSCRL